MGILDVEEKRTDRLAMRLHRLCCRFGEQPECGLCRTRDLRVNYERHHVAGRKGEETMILCQNCHARVSFEQQCFPKEALVTEETATLIGRTILARFREAQCE